jgi:FkbM family methyltransferase
MQPTFPQTQPQPHQLQQQLQAMANNMQFLYDRSIAMHRRLCALEAERTLRAMGRTPQGAIEFRSQFGEDAAIWELLKPELEAGKPQGLIIECGAFDGVRFSVSAGLEAAGWKSLLVEAIPQRFEECKRNRPNARVVHAALSKPGAPATAEFTVVEDHWGGMLSYLSTDEVHKQTIANNRQKSARVSVPQTTMNALLEAHPNIASLEIDAAVIDVEGGEPDLLAGFDLHKWKPKVLMIEDNHRSDGTPVDVAMRNQPYVMFGWVNVNRLYVRKDLLHWQSRLS